VVGWQRVESRGARERLFLMLATCCLTLVRTCFVQ
jgi:hypothetical protein